MRSTRQFKSLLLVFILVVVVHPASLLADAARTTRLTILHTNDTHGHLRPYSYPETFDPSDPIAKLKSRHDIGGAARRATLVRQIRRERGHDTLLIDAGDICDGTPFSTEYQGSADIAAMNAIGYDLACPGNHEFNVPLAQVKKMIADAKFPLLCANVTGKADGKPLYRPYLIKEIAGAKIAFFGLVTYDARTYPAAREGLDMEQPIAVAKRLVPELRRQADLIIAVTHIGVEIDQQLAREVPGIDVIVGGHSHTMLPQPLLINQPASGNPRSVNGTIIVQDYQWAGTLGRLDLTLNRSEEGKWSVEAYKGELLPITSSVRGDKTVAAVVDKFWEPIKGKYAALIGQAAADFTNKGTDDAEYNLVADAVREAYGAEIGIENMGGVRAPLIKGPITYGDMITLDPFGNTIVTFKIDGRQLKEMLRRGRPAVSGIRYVVEGDRLVEASVGGRPIEDSRIYTGTTNSYYVRQPAMSGITSVVDTGKPRLDTVIAYVRSKRTITPSYDGRRVIRRPQR
jgi:5'-nucleotidase / UDP-sugar diphosphatase